MRRFKARRDPCEAPIVEALRKVGASVAFLDGKGLPDLLVGFRGELYLLECKQPLGVKGGKSKDGQHLTPDQEAWHAQWKGRPPAIVRTVEEALRAIGAVP